MISRLSQNFIDITGADICILKPRCENQESILGRTIVKHANGVYVMLCMC